MRRTDADALANLYPEAASYVARHWAPGRLEARSKSIRSSQALCVSVLITLRQRPARTRTLISAAIASEAGLAFPWHSTAEIDAEVREHRDLLGETGGGTPTALDGLITSHMAVLTIESKFTEPEFGSCAQVKPSKVKPTDPRFDTDHPDRRLANCTGIHGPGSDQKWTTQPAEASCRLTVRDGRRAARRYWDVAPQLFRPEVLEVPRRCPFSTDAYQLMRNLAFAHEWASGRQLSWFGFLVTLVDAGPHAQELRARFAAFKDLLLPNLQSRVGVVSYEGLTDVLEEHGEGALASWVRGRLEAALRDVPGRA